VQKVVQDEMAADRSGGVDLDSIPGEEVADVYELENEENNPGFSLTVSILLRSRRSGLPSY
jgi:hypothetical protein